MTTVYAVGDIHGQLAQLEKLHGLILADAEKRPGEKLVIYLGDYIDRGPDSKGVIDLLMADTLGLPTICLIGNHEDLALGGPSHVWLMNGGDATLRSYGGKISAKHLQWMASLPLYHRVGKWYFVHAGVDPALPLGFKQSRETMLWIRAKFLTHEEPYENGTIIVHGHTPGDEPEIEDNRINLDTGACFGGPLSCAVLTDKLEAILQAYPDGAKPMRTYPGAVIAA